MSLLDMSAFVAVTIALSVAVILTYLTVLEKESYLGFWAAGMVVFASTFALDLFVARDPTRTSLQVVTAIAYLTTGILFWAGSMRFIPHKPTKLWIPFVGAGAVLVLVVATSGEWGWLVLVPPTALLAANCVHNGIVLSRSAVETGVARFMASGAFLALAALTLARPFAHLVSSIVPAVYLLTGIFTLAVGLGILFVYVRVFRARVQEGERHVMRQSALLDQVADGIIGLDADFNITAWNRACERIYDLTAEQALGRPVTEVVTSEFLGGTAEELLSDLGPGAGHSWLMRGRDAEGGVTYFEVSGRRAKDAQDDSEYVGVMRDVTERVMAEAQLRSSRERYRTLFESAPIPLWEEDLSELRRALDAIVDSGVKDLRTYLTDHPEELDRCVSLVRVLDVNETAMRLYGATSKKDFLDGIMSFLGAPSKETVIDEFVALADGATTFTGLAELHTRDGRALDIEFTLAVMPGSEETLDRVLVSDMDLTRRKKAERELETYRAGLEDLVERRTQQLQDAYEELQRATRAKDRLLANVSHEMRTPLNSIIGFTGVVMQGLAGDIPEEAQHQLEMANRSGRQLLGLVNDLLDFSQLGSGGMTVTSQLTDVEALVSGTCEVVRAAADAHGLEMKCSTESVPEILTDPDRVRQIILNLLSNAMKYTEEGWIEVSLRKDTQWLIVDVADSGPGIPQDQQPHVFDAFYQLAPVKGAKNSGVGLGLAISREIAGLLGAQIFLESSSAQGSTFRLLLPLDGMPRQETGSS